MKCGNVDKFVNMLCFDKERILVRARCFPFRVVLYLSNHISIISFFFFHLSLKDGNGEAFYPRSTFVINCTGKYSVSVPFFFW